MRHLNPQPLRTFVVSRRHFLAFVFSATAIFLACRALLATAAFRQNPEIGYWGVTFDLCVTIPALYVLMVVRSGRASLVTAIPVFIGCMALARLIVPGPHRDLLHRYAMVQAVLEVAVIVWVLLALRQGVRRGRAETDPVERIRIVCERVFGRGPIAEIVITELTLVILGVGGWRLAPPETAGESTTFHEKAGWGSIVGCIMVLIAAEGVAVHLLLQQWSVVAAWVFTGLDMYSVLWLLGDYQGFRLRPTSVVEGTLRLRFGLRWCANVPLSMIESVQPIDPAAAETLQREPGYLRLAILDVPHFVIRLREPLVVSGLMGWRRRVSVIGMRPDNPSFLDLLVAIPAQHETGASSSGHAGTGAS